MLFMETRYLSFIMISNNMIPSGYKLILHDKRLVKLFKYVRRFVLPQIDDVHLRDWTVRQFMRHVAFSCEIEAALQSFYIDDWELMGVFLHDEDNEVAALVFEKYCYQQRQSYRIAITNKAPHEVIEIGSAGIGSLFVAPEIHKYEIATLAQHYARKSRYADKSYSPSRFLTFKRMEENHNGLVFALDHPRLFFKTLGPKTLFTYAEMKVRATSEKWGRIDGALRTQIENDYPEHVPLLQGFDPVRWHIESVMLSPTLEIEYILMFHREQFGLHLLLDGEFMTRDLFSDDIIYERFGGLWDAALYQDVKRMYYDRLPRDVVPTDPSLTLPLGEPLLVDDDPYAEFRANFYGKLVMVIGPSHLSLQDMETIGSQYGLPKGTIRYDHPDYAKLVGTSFDYLKRNPDNYIGIILGPNPHKMRDLGAYASLSSKFRDEPGYPYAIDACAQSMGKTLKLTKSSFTRALFDLMRFHLAKAAA